jgi:hypothetical protein
MKTWVRRSLNVGVLSAGFLLFTGTAANADMGSGSNVGLLNGTQLDSGIQVPVNLCGNAIGLIGGAGAQCDGGGAAALSGGGSGGGAMNSRGNLGALNGTQLGSTIQVPIAACGNSIGALLGSAGASCGGGGAAAGSGHWWNNDDDDDNGGGSGGYTGSSSYDEKSRPGGTARRIGAFDRTWSTGTGGTMNSVGNTGVLNGTQLNSVIQVPVNVCGNAIGLLGGAGASCSGGGAAALSGGGAGGGAMNSAGGFGIGNGTQVKSLIQVPVNVCGNAIGGLFGNAAASCDGGGAAAGSGSWWNGDDSDDSDDNDGDDGDGDNGGDDPYYEEPTGAGNAHSHGAVNAAHKAATKAAKAAKKLAAATVVDENARGAQTRNKSAANKARGNNMGAKPRRHPGLGLGGGLGTLGLGRPFGTWHHGHNGGGGSSNGYGGNGSGNGSGGGSGWWWGNGGGGAFDTDGCGGGSMSSVGNFGLLNGTQIGSGIQIPVNITGNAIGILGSAGAVSNGGGAAALSC